MGKVPFQHQIHARSLHLRRANPLLPCNEDLAVSKAVAFIANRKE